MKQTIKTIAKRKDERGRQAKEIICLNAKSDKSIKTVITKKQFQTYLEIRDSGITNMFDVRKVVELSSGTLTKEDCIFIMKNFNELWDKYGEK